MRLSMRWAARCREAHGDNAHALFGIVQGGAYQSLRNESADYLLGLALTDMLSAVWRLAKKKAS